MKKLTRILLLTLVTMSLTVGVAFANGSGNTLTDSAVSKANIDNVTATADNNQTFEAGDRAYAIQGDVPMAAMPGYFGDNNKPGHQFISITKLLMYNTAWEIKDKYDFAPGQKVNVTPHTDKVAAADRSEVVVCTKEVFDINKVDLKLLAVGTVNSTNKNVISSDLLDKVLYTASLYGATHVQFLAEGTNTELQSSGWGVGFAYTKATDSSVSTGGTGFSTGWAGYQNLPWQQFMFLKIAEKNAVASTNGTFESEAIETTMELDEQVEKAVQKKTTE